MTFNSVGTVERIRGNAAFTALTISSVEALPLRVIVSSTPREPLERTILFLHVKSVVDLRDIFYINRRAVTVLIGQLLSRSTVQEAAIHANLIFGFRNFGGARGQNQILQVEGVRYINGRKLFGV